MEGAVPIASLGLQWLIHVAWQASVLIALVFVVQLVFRKRLSPAWRHALWLLVVARLALPASWESRASVFNWLPAATPPPSARQFGSGASVSLTAPALHAISRSGSTVAPPRTGRDEPFVAQARLVIGGTDSENPKPTAAARRWSGVWPWLAALWLAGVLALSIRVLIESWRLQKIIAPRRLVTDSGVLELLEDCKQVMGVQVPVVLVQTDLVSSPVLYGFIRPRLLLPSGLLENFSRAELRFVFLHELAHVRRHDIALSWLQTTLQVLHWFNPLVWFAFSRMRAERELACDALVLSRTREGEEKDYGRTMLRLLEGFVRPTRFPAMAGILEDPAQLATRIRCIAAFSRRSVSPAFAISAICVLALATLTDGRIAEPPATQSIWPARFITTRPGANADIRFISVRPSAGIDLQRALSRGRLSLALADDAANLSRSGYKMIGEVDGLGLDRWQRCAREGAPTPRVAHSAIWTGRELIVWGGGARNHFRQSGARYDPATDVWRPVSIAGAPSGRWHHAAQWTGKEMIVWGGRAHFYPTNSFGDGALYDPESDTWRPMNQQGAPAARSQMSSAWTGKEFLVWGGRSDGGTNSYDQPFNDGARYNPETDSWTPMAEVPELGPRYDAAAVWTGRELIVWGGGMRTGGSRQDQNPYLTYGTGGRYDPALDHWTLLPTEGAPHARYKHTVVWSGGEMLVWGGTTVAGDAANPTSESFNDGARFNPATGRWTPISTNGAPGERSSHMAAWTGTDMIVWGGSNAKSECLNTGGRYDPKTDHWSPLTLESAPAPRYMMRPDAGVWTGRQFYVVGGYDLNTEFGTSHGWTPAPALHLYQRAR